MEPWRTVDLAMAAWRLKNGAMENSGLRNSGVEAKMEPYGVGYSDFHNLMGFTSKKMPNNIL
jgi:hypothetical protein